MKSEMILLCARMFNVPTSRLKGLSRSEGAREARFALYAALRMRGNSYKTIGNFLSRDHATIIHGVRVAADLMDADPSYAAKVSELAAWQPDRVRAEEASA
jgi:chromosomal replication initiation ATPase DnaA